MKYPKFVETAAQKFAAHVKRANTTKGTKVEKLLKAADDILDAVVREDTQDSARRYMLLDQASRNIDKEINKYTFSNKGYTRPVLYLGGALLGGFITTLIVSAPVVSTLFIIGGAFPGLIVGGLLSDLADKKSSKRQFELEALHYRSDRLNRYMKSSRRHDVSHIVAAPGFCDLQKQNPKLAAEFSNKAAAQQQERIAALEKQVTELKAVKEEPTGPVVAEPAAVANGMQEAPKPVFRRVKVAQKKK